MPVCGWRIRAGRLKELDTLILALHISAHRLLAYRGNWPKNKAEDCVCACLRLYKKGLTEASSWKRCVWECCRPAVCLFVFMSVFSLALGFFHGVFCCACWVSGLFTAQSRWKTVAKMSWNPLLICKVLDISLFAGRCNKRKYSMYSREMLGVSFWFQPMGRERD